MKATCVIFHLLKWTQTMPLFIDYDEKQQVNYTGAQSKHVWLHSEHTLVKTWQGKMALFK